MIHENIKAFRKAKGMSQEDLADQLHVVRQTVSKWEKGTSSPDAELLVPMAEILGVSVNQLLGIEEDNYRALEEESARLREALEAHARREALQQQAGKKRGMILLLSFAALLLTCLIENQIASLLLVTLCFLTAVVILYRNLDLLTALTTHQPSTGILRLTTIVNAALLVLTAAVALLTALDIITFTEHGEKMFALALISCVILFVGLVAPKLPFNRHTGLRLPWTVVDEDTWNVAHHILSVLSVPLVLLYLACAWAVRDFEAVTLCVMALWVGIPGGLSYLFFRRKMSGR